MSADKTLASCLLAACSLMVSLAVSAQTSEAPLSSTSVSAATEAPPLPGKPVVHRQADAAFARADSNHDGKLSRSEAERLPAISLRFEQLDANKDQYLSRDEFDNALKP